LAAFTTHQLVSHQQEPHKLRQMSTLFPARGECGLLAHVTQLSGRSPTQNLLEWLLLLLLLSRVSFVTHYTTTPANTEMAKRSHKERLDVMEQRMTAIEQRTGATSWTQRNCDH
jgi:hypothetical protein